MSQVTEMHPGGQVPGCEKNRIKVTFPEVTRLVSRPEFFHDLKAAWADVKAQGNLPALLKLQAARPWWSLYAISLDWALIVFSVWTVYAISLWCLPVALVIIGSRHRALSNLVHDASHGNLFKNRKWNDFITNIAAAVPMQDTVRSYQRFHGLHHANLGTLTEDPDAVTHLTYGFNDLNPWRGSFLKNYVRLASLGRSWKDTMIGGFASLAPKEKACVVTWWASAILVMNLLGGLPFTLSFLAIWLLARASTYHLIRLFAEFLDHTGLDATSVVNFSRTLPHVGLFSWMFHPHQDTYHLVHHLAPNVPHYNLKAASRLFGSVSTYQNAHHCDAYFFFGRHRATDCMTGRCRSVGH